MDMTSSNTARLHDRAIALLRKNRRTKDEYQYTVPSPDSYPYQWMWDSCFHAIVLAYFEIADAKKELESLCAKQFGNGLIPHIIYWDGPKKGVIDFEWGKSGTSSITQPPMLAYAAWHIYQRDHDRAFLERIYPKLYHFHNYLLTDRDPRRNFLVSVINPDESGEDDSPRFDRAVRLPPQHTLEENLARRLDLIETNKSCNFDAPFCVKNHFWVKDVPFNAILVRNLGVMGDIAEELERMDEAFYFRRLQLQVAEAMRDRMHSNGLFWSLAGEEYEKIYVKTWAIFAPLFAGILSKSEAHDLVALHLHDDESFNAPFSVPTVARHEPSYNPDGFWRGPVWTASNWFIFKGLLDYGFEDEAARIRDHSIALIEQSGFRERFNPETGAGIGAHEFTWGTLTIDMLEDTF